LAVGTAAIASFPSFVLSDPLGVIAWAMVVAIAVGGGAVITTATFLIRRTVGHSSVTDR